VERARCCGFIKYKYFAAIKRYCLLVTPDIIHFRIIFLFPNSLGLKIDVQFKVREKKALPLFDQEIGLKNYFESMSKLKYDGAY
jgi:hypothetical protein